MYDDLTKDLEEALGSGQIDESEAEEIYNKEVFG